MRNPALKGPRGNYACTAWLPPGVPLYLTALLTPGGEPSSAFCPGLSHSFSQQMFLMSGSGPETYLSHASEEWALPCAFPGQDWESRD